MKGGGLYSIVMIVLLFGLMYFMMIRPQKKQQQQWQNMINNLKKGDHVVTRGGLHGVIDSIDKANKTVTLDCDGIFLTFSLNAIGNVQSASAAQQAQPAEPAKEEKADSQAEDKETK
ncbi:MAG TPA: preprotein translocase subunit YajC [Candidatus Ligilactobacillus faecavium]|nr:preprotein translocase subunit YajC [Candidatus Ligilactobacillus faecavium]